MLLSYRGLGATSFQCSGVALLIDAGRVARQFFSKFRLVNGPCHMAFGKPGVVHDALFGRNRQHNAQRRIQQAVKSGFTFWAAAVELARKRCVQPFFCCSVLEELTAPLKRDGAAGQRWVSTFWIAGAADVN